MAAHISLISKRRKIFEKAMNSRLYAFLDKHGCFLHEKQLGF